MIGVILFFCGFVFSHFVPPPSPSLTQEQVVLHYQTYANEIRGAMVIFIISGMFVVPMFGLISAQIKRMEGVSPALCYAQLCAGATNAMFFFIPGLMFVVTAYRPERNPELTFLLNDMSWIFAVLPWPPAFIQNIVFAAAILTDKSAQPIFPRWLAYLNIWVSLAYIPGGLLPFFKSVERHSGVLAGRKCVHYLVCCDDGDAAQGDQATGVGRAVVQLDWFCFYQSHFAGVVVADEHSRWEENDLARNRSRKARRPFVKQATVKWS